MINPKNKLLVLFLALSALLQGQVMWEIKKDTVITWYYQEGDEFNGNSVNRDYWKYSGWARSLYMNKEQQYYSEGTNHVVNEGTLKLIAKKDSVTKRTVDWMNDNDSLKSGNKFITLNKKTFTYTSGQLETKNKYNRGFFECRFRLPEKKGYWPAFWLYGGSPNEEIDFLEAKTERRNQLHIDTHCPNRCDLVSMLLQKKSFGGWVKTDYDFSKDFNVVAGEWDQDQIRFYLNGECIGISSVKFDIDKVMVLNMAVPSDDGPFKPGPDKNDNSEAAFEVDYVRVWKKTSGQKKNVTSTASNFTSVQTGNALLSKGKSRTKSKVVYGGKNDHASDGVFISFFNNKDVIQITTLGVFDKDVPAYKIKDGSGKELLAGTISGQIFDIPKASLPKGELLLVVEWQGKTAQEKIIVN